MQIVGEAKQSDESLEFGLALTVDKKLPVLKLFRNCGSCHVVDSIVDRDSQRIPHTTPQTRQWKPLAITLEVVVQEHLL